MNSTIYLVRFIEQWHSMFANSPAPIVVALFALASLLEMGYRKSDRR